MSELLPRGRQPSDRIPPPARLLRVAALAVHRPATDQRSASTAPRVYPMHVQWIFRPSPSVYCTSRFTSTLLLASLVPPRHRPLKVSSTAARTHQAGQHKKRLLTNLQPLAWIVTRGRALRPARRARLRTRGLLEKRSRSCPGPGPRCRASAQACRDSSRSVDDSRVCRRPCSSAAIPSPCRWRVRVDRTGFP